MISALRSGSWLLPHRIRATALFSLLGGIGMFGWLLATSHGTLDATGRPLGTDFSNVWSAGAMALQGDAAQVWNWAAHYAAQQHVHGRADIPFYPWPYPPPFLLIASALARLPYVLSLLVWQIGTLLLATRVYRAILPGGGPLLIALGAPVVFLCIGHGQNGFLTAALLGGGLLLLDRRPVVAGALLGCLLYKPQFALALPVLLLAGRHGRAILSAACSAGILIAATLILWGWSPWQAFFESLPATRHIIMENGDTGWEKIQSLFAAARNIGLGVNAAWWLQAAMTAVALAATGFAARRASADIRNAIVMSGALLSTPYVLDYDLVTLGFAGAFLARAAAGGEWLPWERSLLAFAWIAPLFTRAVMAGAGIPLGWLALVAVLALGLRRAVRSSPFRRSHAGSAR